MTDNPPAPLAFSQNAPTRRNVNIWWKGDGEEERLCFVGPFEPNGDWIGRRGGDGADHVFYAGDGDPLARMFHHAASRITELALSGKIGWLEQRVAVSVSTDSQMRRCRMLTFSPLGSPSDDQIGNREKWATNICLSDGFEAFNAMKTIPFRLKHHPERLADALRIAFEAVEEDLRLVAIPA